MDQRRIVLGAVLAFLAACGGGRSLPHDGGGGTGGTTGDAGTTGAGGTTGVAGTTGIGGGGTGGTTDAGGGRGGTTGLGGGTTGFGGVGGKFAPACVEDLMTACPTDTCVGSGASGDGGTATCFASGARAQSGPSTTCANPGMGAGMSTAVTVTKPDGSLCYTVERCCDIYFCESELLTWKDAAGVVVATGGVNRVGSNSGASVTCTATGETARFPHARLFFYSYCPSGNGCP